MLSNVSHSAVTSWNVSERCGICGNVAMLWNVADSSGIYRKLMKCGGSWCEVAEYVGMLSVADSAGTWRSVVECGCVWDVSECFEM